MEVSDQQLIARVIMHKDQRAFAQLVLRYQSQLRLWARRLCDGDIHLADDLAQEVFIKAYAALPGFRGDSKFSTWLYRIAFNIAAQRWRAKKIHWIAMDENSDTPADACELQQFAAKQDINAAMRQLKTAQQLAICLCFEEGFSHEEAADIMKIPLGTLKTHVARGKQKLQELLSSWQQSE